MNEYTQKDRRDLLAFDKPLTTDREFSSRAEAEASNLKETDQEHRTLVTPPPAESVPSSSLSGAPSGVAVAPAEEKAQLFSSTEANELRAKWESLQVGFVDEPRRSVEEAEALVSSTLKRLSEVFANERDNLEQQWEKRGDVSTEDLRVALRRYRSFFNRLLTV